jgi:hypothetical protein
VALFEKLMKRDDLFWEPRHWAIVKSEFKSLLKRATAGSLKPVTHVKDIDRAAKEFVFEIRHDFQVVEIDANGNKTHRKTRVRLYITEPPAHPDHVIGLHLHEKVVVDGDNDETNRLQNIEIDAAVARYNRGRANNWGITDLAAGAGHE